MRVKIEESWQKVLQPEFEKEYFKNLIAFVKEEYAKQTRFTRPANRFFMPSKNAPSIRWK